MIIWVVAVLWYTVIVMVYQSKDTEGPVETVARCLAVALYTVPAIYATGWLLLPAYGVFR